MPTLTLPSGHEIIVDDADLPAVSAHTWYAAPQPRTFYAASRINRRLVCMHRWLLGTPPGQDTDHRNGNGLDNRRENLRACSRSQNCFNRDKIRGLASSRHKGASWHRQTKKWRAYINVDGKTVHLGLFNTEVEAALAYDTAAMKFHGAFAKLNFT